MDELEQLGALARSKVLLPRPAPSARETRRANRALWAIAFGVVAASLGVFYLRQLFEPSGGGGGQAGGIFPPLRKIIWGLLLAMLDVIAGSGAIALGLSAVHAEHERYSVTALIAVILGSVGWLGLFLVMLP